MSIEKLQKTYQSEIEASMKEYQTKLQTYSADTQNQTEVTNQARAKELQGMEQNIQQYQQPLMEGLINYLLLILVVVTCLFRV